ncbi:quinolinate phosphoribosyl transferase [Vibrio phage 1.081.O._10N.286.52.C2]|nr:quinolinate phosphoribosyl transferase [Vibrio phage 1.081.O._10N.286.52.C2]
MLTFKKNLPASTDSYKVSHWLQFMSGLQFSQYYVESRGGKFDKVMVDGMAYMCRILEQGVTSGDVKYAKRLFQKHFGSEVFNTTGWDTIVNELDGKLPIRIRAIREGEVIPVKTPLLVIENTDPRFGWLPGYLETFILRAIWYPTTVATVSFEVKKIIRSFMKKTVNDDQIAGGEPFKLHDFGSRGVSSGESASIGGGSHLKNFWGTDNVEALMAVEQIYAPDVEEFIAGFSIPAREHSTTTIYTEMHEDAAFLNSIEQFGSGLYACVMDSYNYDAAMERISTGRFKELIIAKGGTFVARPDSGVPVDVVMRGLEILGKNVGYTVNDKGYKVLHPSFRIIQGDGVNIEEIQRILSFMESKKWSAENIAFGMGGGLLQQSDRDTQRFAMKMSAAIVNGEYVAVFKMPKTDPSKASKSGFLDVIATNPDNPNPAERGYFTVSSEDYDNRVHSQSIMRTIFENGVTVENFDLDYFNEARRLSDVQANFTNCNEWKVKTD